MVVMIQNGKKVEPKDIVLSDKIIKLIEKVLTQR